MQNKFADEVMAISHFMNDDIKKHFNNLHRNKFQADCLQVSALHNEIIFENPFGATPEVFIATARYLVTYGDRGVMEKKDLQFAASPEKISFTISDIGDNTDVPVCYLAIEK